MENFTIFWGVLLAIATGISAIGGAWKYIKELKKPYNELVDRVVKLEQDTKKSKDDLARLEKKMTDYVNEKNDETMVIVDNIKRDISALRSSIETNEQDTKLILKEIFHLGNYLASGDKETLNKLLGMNNEIINHLIDEK